MDTMQPYFRDAVPSDLPAIGAILRSVDAADGSGASTVGSYRDALAEIDRTDGNYVLVAEFDSQIVAVLQLLSLRQIHDRGGRSASIVMLRVADAFTTSGVGAMLVEHAVERAADLGCGRVRVSCSTGATDEHSFWERNGFVQLERGYVRPVRTQRI